MSNDLERFRPSGNDMAVMVSTFGQLAEQVARTDFVPADFRGNTPAVLAAMMYGHELGLGPMQSLNMITSIKGRVGLRPEAMRAMVVTSGHRIWTEEYTDTVVAYAGWRKGDPADLIVRTRFTIEDAKRAGLVKNESAYVKYPRAALSGRATAELCRLHFADVIGGLSYTPDELGDMDEAPMFVTPSAPIEAPALEVVASKSAAALLKPYTDKLSKEQLAALKVWREGMGYPTPSQMGPLQVEATIAHIEAAIADVAETPVSGPGPSPDLAILEAAKTMVPPATADGLMRTFDDGEKPEPPKADRDDQHTPVTVKEAQRVHIVAKEFSVDDVNLDILVFGATNGRSDSAKELTKAEQSALIHRLQSDSWRPSNWLDLCNKWAAWAEARNAAVTA